MFKLILNLPNRFLSDLTFRSTIILFLGQLIANFINYLFNLGLGRILSKDSFGESEYGEFWTLNSLIFLITIPVTTLTVIATKKTSEALARDEMQEIKTFYQNISKVLLIISFATIILSPILLIPVKIWLHIDSLSILFIFYAIIIFSILNSLPSGIVNGLHKFTLYSFTSAIVALVKFIVGISLALIIGVKGGLIGNLLFPVILFLVLSIYLRREFKKIDLKSAFSFDYKYFLWVLAFNFAMGALISVDVLVIKHYFTGVNLNGSEIDIPSIFSALSFFGKIVFFLSFSLSQALVPLSSFTNEKKGSTKNILYKIIFLNFLLIIPTVLIMFLIPQELMRIVFNEKYLEGAKYLGIYNLSIFFFSLSAVLGNYFISLSKKSFVIIPVLGAAIQIILFILFHNSLSTFILIQLTVSILLFVSFVVYFSLIKR